MKPTIYAIGEHCILTFNRAEQLHESFRLRMGHYPPEPEKSRLHRLRLRAWRITPSGKHFGRTRADEAWQQYLAADRAVRSCR